MYSEFYTIKCISRQIKVYTLRFPGCLSHGKRFLLTFTALLIGNSIFLDSLGNNSVLHRRLRVFCSIWCFINYLERIKLLLKEDENKFFF